MLQNLKFEQQYRSAGTLLLSVLLLVYGLVLVRTAWLCDDAFITIRTIDNFVHGYGLRWNVTERVQSFTHPLWLFLLTIPYAVTGEAFFTVTIVSILVSFLSVLFLTTKVLREKHRALFALSCILFSRSLIDYSTSGLETPLLFFLLICFSWQATSDEKAQSKILVLSLLSSGIALTRPDCILLCLPVLTAAFLQRPDRVSARKCLLGLLPLVLWGCFSVFYYGFPFPNTAYAKLSTGIPARDLAIRGLEFLMVCSKEDPLTSLIVVAGLASFFWDRRPMRLSLCAGVLALLFYIVKIGGGFMLGRYPAPAAVVCLVLLARSSLLAHPIRAALFSAIFIAAGVIARDPLSTLSLSYPSETEQPMKAFQIADERGFYFPESSFLRNVLSLTMVDNPWLKKPRRKARKKRSVIVQTAAGLGPYLAGPDSYFIDELALTDPLLARLPAYSDTHWRTGHFRRVIPSGYVASIRKNENRLHDQNLARFYEKLIHITQSPLLSWDRMKTIVLFNLGAYSNLINFQYYRHPPPHLLPEQRPFTSSSREAP